MTSSDTAPASDSPRGGASLAETFLRPFMKLAAVQPGERVLDLASASADAAVEAAARAGATGEVLVAGPDPAVSEAATARTLAAGLTLPRTAAMDPARLELPGVYWDVVICHFGLPDVEDPERMLKEVQRVLRPVGRFAVSVLGERERCPLVTILLDVLGEHVPAARGVAQRLFRYSPTGLLARLLAEQGFEDAVPDRSTEWAPFRDVDDYWETVTTTTRFGALAAALSPEQVQRCKAEITKRTRFYRRGGGIELKVEAVMLVAVK